MKWEPKTYYDNKAVIVWGLNLTAEQMDRLKKGEIFYRTNPNGEVQTIFMDSYNQIRESCQFKKTEKPSC
ncbi:MAG: hypothetical protein JRC90_10650 [Deltaproteobacteria bacterium]|nr:hypothetical protein [Deltaproteobacteria bacterium]